MENTAVRTSGPDEGRLTTLPDALLVEIVSRLPVESAAVTSALSRRWKHLWTQLTRLTLSFPDTSANNFPTTVDHILLQLTTAKLRSCHISISDPAEDEVGFFLSRLGSSWVPQICARNPDSLTMSLSLSDEEVFFNLPTCVLTTNSLTNLILDGVCLVIPRDGVTNITFTNLKRLELGLCLRDSDDCKWVTSLFKSCPVLVRLNVKFYMDETETKCVLHISVPCLEYLSVNLCGFPSNLKVVIAAPKLEYVGFRGFLAVYEFVESPSALRQVVVDLDGFLRETAGFNLDCLFRQISRVENLHLSVSTISCINRFGTNDVLPVFPHLVHLKILGYTILDRISHLTVPSFLLNKLERLEMTVLLECISDEIQLIVCILDGAKELKKLEISVGGRKFEHDKEEQRGKESKFCDALSKLKPSSESCQIEFAGRFVSASSDGMGSGLLHKSTL